MTADERDWAEWAEANVWWRQEGEGHAPQPNLAALARREIMRLVRAYELSELGTAELGVRIAEVLERYKKLTR